MSAHFLYFLFKWKELNQQVCVIQYVENEREREREREEQKQSNFKNISKTPETFSLVTLVTNYHKLSLLPLVIRPWHLVYQCSESHWLYILGIWEDVYKVSSIQVIN